MTVSVTDTQALDTCRQAAATEAARLGGAGDTFPDGGCSPTTFGRLAASATAASAVDAMDRHLRTEFAAAERLLLAVEQALDAVETSVRNADDDSATRLSTTAGV